MTAHTPETLAALLAAAGDTDWVDGVLGTSEDDTEIGYIRTSGQNVFEVMTGNPDVALVANSGARPLLRAAPTLATELSAALVREKALREALIEIDALDPEHLIDSCAQTAMRGLVLRMGEIARAALATTEERG